MVLCWSALQKDLGWVAWMLKMEEQGFLALKYFLKSLIAFRISNIILRSRKVNVLDMQSRSVLKCNGLVRIGKMHSLLWLLCFRGILNGERREKRFVIHIFWAVYWKRTPLIMFLLRRAWLIFMAWKTPQTSRLASMALYDHGTSRKPAEFVSGLSFVWGHARGCCAR